MTPREALAGIVGALEWAASERCRLGPTGTWCHDGAPDGVTCEHRVARAALAAFEKRQPLREDAGVLLALAHFVSDNLTAGEAADLIDAALFGPPTKEGSRGK